LAPSPSIALRLECPHAGSLRAHAILQGSYLIADQSPVSLLAAHGGAGLGWKPEGPWPQGGIGFSLTYIRETERHRDPDRYFFFGDGESEFGFYPFLSWSLPLGPDWTFETLTRWDMQFTEPHWTHTSVVQIGLGRNLRWAGPF
jgi:hypothetical protein